MEVHDLLRFDIVDTLRPAKSYLEFKFEANSDDEFTKAMKICTERVLVKSRRAVINLR